VDDPTVRQIAKECRRRVLTYGFSPDAELTAIDIRPNPDGMEFGVRYRGAHLGTFKLPMLGRHLVQNCLAAIAVGLEFGLSIETIRGALASFGGVKRRLEVIGTTNGVTVMNDYGHHPTEIRATIRAVRECFASSIGRLVVVFQPHRYTRTQMCWNEYLNAFGEADDLILGEVYAASEEPIVGVSGEALLAEIQHPNREFCANLDDVPMTLASRLKAGDFVVCLGAGSVGGLPEKLLAALGSAVLPSGADNGDAPVLKVVVGGK
jgi:UDP-N-acetylmuramate--alanine ligase